MQDWHEDVNSKEGAEKQLGKPWNRRSRDTSTEDNYEE
jgi:hypothetical protein